ncbi:unnamed protein product [Brassica napus]|uniref:(rape) hypothetical protein n=1 Tax=Brassica napus TaxID=3708 RepID=A0A816MTW4_BRANA|nr:unnamed protein product [Brassica napus]
MNVPTTCLLCASHDETRDHIFSLATSQENYGMQSLLTLVLHLLPRLMMLCHGSKLLPQINVSRQYVSFYFKLLFISFGRREMQDTTLRFQGRYLLL